jgi:hypothetical protein
MGRREGRAQRLDIVGMKVGRGGHEPN